MSDDAGLPDFADQAVAGDDVGLDFSSEEDLLDVDKLRDVFQSVLDDPLGDDSGSPDIESDGDLLFLEDSILEDEHEPEVTFSLDEEDEAPGPKQKKKTK